MKSYTIADLLPLLRGNAWSRKDEGLGIILAPECEEWTHIYVNVNSGFLDMISNVIVQSVDTDDGRVRLWLDTDDFNCPRVIKWEAHNGE